MILQTSLDQHILNISRLSSHAIKREAASLEELAYGYRSFLSSQRPNGAKNIRYELGYDIIHEPAMSEQLGRLFTTIPATELDDLDQLNTIEFHNGSNDCQLNIINDGLDVLKSMCPQHASLFGLLISEIILLPSSIANGGSTSNAVGIVWANPSRGWRHLDSVEFLIHEFTHHCMFVDEICNGHYDYAEVLKKENWTDSAILNKPRPADKVLHSIVVATEILLAREHILGHPASPRCHPPSTTMKHQTENAIRGLTDLLDAGDCKDLLTARALQVLNSCKAAVAGIDTSSLEH